MTADPMLAPVIPIPHVCGNCGQEWWSVHVCPNLTVPMSLPLFPGALPTYPSPPLIQLVGKDQLDKAQIEVERLRDALKVARDFIAHHPAVAGEWPLVLQVIDVALDG